MRLAIAVLLSRWDRLSFTRLRELTGETDGSLGAHMRRLEEAHGVKPEPTPLAAPLLRGREFSLR